MISVTSGIRSGAVRQRGSSAPHGDPPDTRVYFEVPPEWREILPPHLLAPWFERLLEVMPARERRLLDTICKLRVPTFSQTSLATHLRTSQSRIAEPFKGLVRKGIVVFVGYEQKQKLWQVVPPSFVQWYQTTHTCT